MAFRPLTKVFGLNSVTLEKLSEERFHPVFSHPRRDYDECCSVCMGILMLGVNGITWWWYFEALLINL